MAANLPSSTEGDSLISDINVTPFVDVVLVLLVIFIVTAPALVKDTLGIKLPKAASADGSAMETLGVAVTRQGQILLNGTIATEEAVTAAVKAALSKNPDAQAIIAADGEARHADVVRAIDLVKTAGMSRFALQIERPEKTETKAGP
ncbi:MAG: biopolymer transporter ExbD [Bdellovibrionales bacterium]|nr:biopolymer transporter ExbD [Bdellovibrionales bacterium]